LCTGYELTDALRRYLEVGHGRNHAEELSNAIAEDATLGGIDCDVYPQVLASDREVSFVMSYQQDFSIVRRAAPAEIRKALEIPHMYDNGQPAPGPNDFLFIPTGAYTREQYDSGALSFPSEADRKAIQSFIDTANSLLPDVVRDEASLKLEDMRYEIHHLQALMMPPYNLSEREELLPPRHLLPLI
ncbi:hypothetical protein DICSQDRAFT_14731, partial [Dichomitus squalens LYAD-421 SS1]|uniref:uncharacterized protein n=1 Tax=Dichomitus squalens (strain LYAD-421) TaxID=732165 RepID=UPI00044110E2